MSDIARSYPPASAPGLIAGTAAANSAGAGTVKQAGKEPDSNRNADLSRDYRAR